LYINALILLALGYFIAKAISPVLIVYLKQNNMLCKNYMGFEIVTGAGLIILTTLTFVFTFLIIMTGSTSLTIFLFGCIITSLVGLLDDIWGNNLNKGFNGHFRTLVEGNLTTGSIKAIVGFVTAIIVSKTINASNLTFILNTGIFILSINSINLFDLRPGRAIKYFLLNISVVIAFLGMTQHTIWIFSLLGILFHYAPLDFSSKVMLGDTGSNLLGFILGYYLVLVPSNSFKYFALGLLVLIQWYSEKNSISKLICQVKFLYFLDLLGRPKHNGSP
jgi:UDP-GlcNAc:undecaprenyl-phosphate GlcNAc-1-phosphate transferase